MIKLNRDPLFPRTIKLLDVAHSGSVSCKIQCTPFPAPLGHEHQFYSLIDPMN